jgi:RsiW-degrading membrane proteinase PrsW (M82 family)
MTTTQIWRLVAWTVIGLGILGSGLLTAFLGGAITLQVGPLAALVAAFIAVVPPFFYLALVLALDAYEPEPPALLLFAFLWGSGVATLTGALATMAHEAVFEAVVEAATGNPAQARQWADLFGTCVGAPFTEEVSKGLFLVALFLFKKDEFNGIVDGVIYGTLVGLGFDVLENFAYHGGFIAEAGLASGTASALFRELFFASGHPLYASLTGMGLGLARQSRHLAARLLAPGLGFGAAFILHASWNTSATLSGEALGLWPLLIALLGLHLPAMLFVLGVVLYNVRREALLVRELLEPDVAAGRLRAEDFRYLPSLPGRLGAQGRALARGGPGALWACTRFIHDATELALLRQRRRLGQVSPASADELEAELWQRLARHRAGFP